MSAIAQVPDINSFRNIRSKAGEPTVEILEYLPRQGRWTEREYLLLFDERGIELVNGFLEVLPLPTNDHQYILDFLYAALKEFVNSGELGKTAFSGIRVRLPNGTYREPDIAFVSSNHKQSREGKNWDCADLVMEIVTSPEGRDRDYIDKRADYASAGIPEYWIVDPRDQVITVLKLNGSEYVNHGVFKRGEQATSSLLKGFSVDVSSVLDAD